LFAQANGPVTPDDPKIVTIAANQPLPPVGSLVEVEYLYAFPSGALFQPVYKGLRTDKRQADPYTSLKFKQQSGDGG
jgi:bifunctional non-homologous end joining protein LigD